MCRYFYSQCVLCIYLSCGHHFFLFQLFICSTCSNICTQLKIIESQKNVHIFSRHSDWNGFCKRVMKSHFFFRTRRLHAIKPTTSLLGMKNHWANITALKFEHSKFDCYRNCYLLKCSDNRTFLVGTLISI